MCIVADNIGIEIANVSNYYIGSEDLDYVRKWRNLLEPSDQLGSESHNFALNWLDS
jgi:hypothetical protein